MTGPLAQIISITSFGNAYLNGNDTSTFYPENSTFQHCDFVDFREMRKKNFLSAKKEYVISENPNNWFEYLKNNNYQKLRLSYQTVEQNDHQLAGFVGGGGNWFLETIHKNHSEFWISRWNHDKKLERKPWQVTYGKAISNKDSLNQQFGITETKKRLQNALSNIIEFAYAETTEHWAMIFEKAKNTLSSENPKIDFYHQDLIKWKNYELANQQLLMSASKSFVFGGMGSWNDMWFNSEETQKRFDKVSTELYSAMMQSIVCSINDDKFE